jgi:hypothetical protein
MKINPHCEICSEKDSLEFDLPPCDICPYHDVEENFDDIEEEVSSYA